METLIYRHETKPRQTASIGEPGRRKLFLRVLLVLAWAFLIFSVGFNGFQVAGYRLISTRGESMEPTFSAGSLLIARLTGPEEIKAGDIITFDDPLEGVSVVHRVVVFEKAERRAIAITMGDNNPVPDPGLRTLEGPVPRVVFVIPHLGWWITPSLGWYLLAICGLLSIRICLRWRDRRKVAQYQQAVVRRTDGRCGASLLVRQ